MNQLQQGYFLIASVSREELEDAGYDTSNITDDTMESIAMDMGNAYREDGLWIDLPIIADNFGIPKIKKPPCKKV